MSKKETYSRIFQTLSLFIILILLYSCASGLKTQTPILGPERFSKEIDSFIKWDKKNSSPENAILFVGSSSIKLWNTAISFPNLIVINRGFGGSQISDVNHFYEQIVKKYNPSKIIFYAGDNDIAAGKSADQVLEDYQIFVAKVEQDLPKTKIFYLPIKPSLNRWHLWPQMSSANEMIKHFSKNKINLFYVETTSAMLDETLRPNPDLLIEDGLHMNDRGYQIWTKILLPLIKNKKSP